MNKSDLESILKKARLPEPPQEYWESFPRQIAARLNRERESWSSSFSLSGRRTSVGITLKRGLQRLFPRPAWGFALAVCAAIIVATVHWHAERETASSDNILQNAKLIRETLSMFPNRVRAIVYDKNGMSLVLSDRDDVPASTPLYVRICDGKECSSRVTFSGQEIQLAGQTVTVLSDAKGNVLLVGNHFVWSSAERGYAQNDLKIEAKSLAAVTM